jgi:hypothetical protein
MAKSLNSALDVLVRKSSCLDRPKPFSEIPWLPIGLFLLNSLPSTCAEVLIKIGATHPPSINLPVPVAFVSTIFSFWVALSIFAYFGSLSVWLVALPRLPLHLAYGLSSTVPTE